jgi:hypothetical protein
LVDEKGTVALSRISVKVLTPGSFDVDCEPLFDEVMKTFKRVGVETAKAIASLVAGLNEPDEN